MRTKTVKVIVTMKIRVHDEPTEARNDVHVIGSIIGRWVKNQPTINKNRDDTGILKMTTEYRKRATKPTPTHGSTRRTP